MARAACHPHRSVEHVSVCAVGVSVPSLSHAHRHNRLARHGLLGRLDSLLGLGLPCLLGLGIPLVFVDARNLLDEVRVVADPLLLSITI